MRERGRGRGWERDIDEKWSSRRAGERECARERDQVCPKLYYGIFMDRQRAKGGGHAGMRGGLICMDKKEVWNMYCLIERERKGERGGARRRQLAHESRRLVSQNGSME